MFGRMLIPRATLEAIAAGDVDLVYRRWKKPTVKAGSTVHTAVGLLEIGSIDAVPMRRIRAADARRAGYPTRAALMDQLTARQGTTYRIEVRYAGRDPRIALRETAPTAEERAAIEAALARLPWAHDTLRLIQRHPEVRAEDLAARMGLTKKQFKPRVRRLKALGLTISLSPGYRLSRRGEALLES